MPDPAADDPPVRPRCPRCTAALRKVSMDRGASVHGCGTCGGMFVAARAWCMFLERPDLVRAVERRLPKRGPVPASPAAFIPLVTCASCGAQMERGRFAASSGVVVDVCPRHGVWLDQGQLALVAEYAHSPSRFEEATPAEHPVMVAIETKRRRVEAKAAKPPSKPPRPLWMKLLPALLFAVGLAARWYYVQKLATEQGVSIPEQGADARQAGEQGYRALGDH